MIRYSLKCDAGHVFESWFASAQAYDALAVDGRLECAVCGSAKVEKALMTPKVSGTDRLDAPDPEVAAKIAALRKRVEAEATYVGGRFAEEARAIHDTGDDKPIYGEANAAEVKGLLDDGVPIAPLPFLPKAKAN